MSREYLDPNEINIGSRQRRELGEVEKLAESLKELGQIHPIVIDENNNLVAGHRRLDACRLLGIDVWVTRFEGLSPIEKEEIELDENLRRKDLTWYEKALAKVRLLALRKTQDGRYSIRRLSEDLGEAVGLSITDVKMVELSIEHPEIVSMPTKAEASRYIKRVAEQKVIEELAERAVGEEKADITEHNRKRVAEISERIIEGDCLKIMAGWGENLFDLVITDPPFGIELAKKRSSKTEGYVSPETELYDMSTGGDTSEGYIELMQAAIPLMFKVMKRDSHLYMFFGVEKYQVILDLLTDSGFIVDPIPMIWYKGSGQVIAPEIYPARTYEAFFYARKGQLPLAKQGLNNVLNVQPINSSSKFHPTQKPLALMAEILGRSVCHGMSVLDPFCGTGSTLRAAHDLYLDYIGIELEPYFVQLAVSQVTHVCL